MARGAELADAKIAPVFPITPQTQVIEALAEGGQVEVMRGNSEYNVISMASGAAWAGTRVFTATSSHGLVMMSEMMWEIAGNRLPVVMGVFGRALKGPGWCLGTQQNDSLMMRDTGWLQFYCESAQELLDMILVAYRIAEEWRLPVMVVGDGFYLSHANEPVDVPAEALVRRFLPAEPPSDGLPASTEPATFGPLVTPEQYFDFYRTVHDQMEQLADGPLQDVFSEFSSLFGREYDLIETHNAEDSEIVVVAMSTVAGTVRAELKSDPDRYADVGFVKLRSIRPFPGAKLTECLRNARKIIVIDRNLSPCIGGIVSTELAAELQRFGLERLPQIYSVVSGLGGMPVSREMIRNLVADVENSTRPERVYFLK